MSKELILRRHQGRAAADRSADGPGCAPEGVEAAVEAVTRVTITPALVEIAMPSTALVDSREAALRRAFEAAGFEVLP